MKNKWVVITGGAGYLSYYISKDLLINNYKLILWDKNFKKLKFQKNKLLSELNINKSLIKIKKINITSKLLVQKEINRLDKLKYSIYALLNCASNNPTPNEKNIKFGSKKFLNQWEQDIKIGLTGAAICSYIISNYFLKTNKNGRVINFSSDLGIIAPNQNIYKYNGYIKPLSYSVVKHGIIGITKYFSTLYGNTNIRYNTICYGPIISKKMDKKLIKEISKLIPINRLGKVNEISSPILFLLDKKNSFMNGHSLIIDGGRTIW